jgi:hypothetical protein
MFDYLKIEILNFIKLNYMTSSAIGILGWGDIIEVNK